MITFLVILWLMSSILAMGIIIGTFGWNIISGSLRYHVIFCAIATGPCAAPCWFVLTNFCEKGWSLTRP